MVDIFDEVDEDLRAERAQQLARKYGWVAVLAAVLIVAGVAGWQFYQRWQAQRDAGIAARYIAAMDAIQQAPSVNTAAKEAQAGPLEALAQTAPGGYQTLAKLTAAGLKAEAGDISGAVTLYNQVAADSQADRLLRDLASLLVAEKQMDKANPQDLAARLEPLALPGNPWAPLAREQLAVLDLRQGKVDDAKAKLQALAADVLAPSGVRARANALLGGLG